MQAYNYIKTIWIQEHALCFVTDLGDTCCLREGNLCTIITEDFLPHFGKVTSISKEENSVFLVQEGSDLTMVRIRVDQINYIEF